MGFNRFQPVRVDIAHFVLFPHNLLPRFFIMGSVASLLLLLGCRRPPRHAEHLVKEVLQHKAREPTWCVLLRCIHCVYDCSVGRGGTQPQIPPLVIWVWGRREVLWWRELHRSMCQQRWNCHGQSSTMCYNRLCVLWSKACALLEAMFSLPISSLPALPSLPAGCKLSTEQSAQPSQ